MTDPNGSAAGGQPGADGGAGTAGAAAPWYGTDATDDIKGLVELKGWDSPVKAIDSYRNLEKLLGADKAGRAIVWPKDELDTEGWKTVHAKLGVPETADGYKIPVPDGGNAEFAKAIAPVMHKLGLSAKQAEGLAAYVNEFEAAAATKYEAEAKARIATEVEAFKTELGQAYQPTVELGKRAATALGVTDQQFSALEEVLGLKGTVSLFADIGKKLGEDTFVAGAGPAGGVLSPAAAKQKLAQLGQDRSWVAKLSGGDAEVTAEWKKLTAWANSQAAA
jgi:hypothetical protein